MASLWDSFKKKIEKTSSGLDFWDTQENKQQRDMYAGIPQSNPSNTGVLQVEKPRTQPTLTVDNTPNTQTISVTPDFSNKQELYTPDGTPVSSIPDTPETIVNRGLDAGKSWEDISRETGYDLNGIREYSKATRPNYGVARIEKPQQSNWNKIRDTLDANTEADKWRRQEANDNRPASEQVAITSENPGNIVSNTVGAIPRMFNTAGNQIVEVGFTAQQQFATQEYSAATNDYMLAVKSGNPVWIAQAKQRANDAAQRVSDIEANLKATKENYKLNSGGLFNAGTMYDEKDSYEGGMHGVKNIVTNTGEGMLDVATLGLGSVTAKQIGKQGIKTALKEGGEVLAKNAALNTTQGMLGAVRQDGDVGDVIQAGVVSGTLGTVADVGLAGGGALVGKTGSKARNKIVDLIDNTTTKIDPESAIAKLSKEATNSIENTNFTKPNGVERAGQFVENGSAPPIKVRKLDDGSTVIVDGTHRLEYARKNGINDFPIEDVTEQFKQTAQPLTGAEKMQLDYLTKKAKQELLDGDERDLLNTLSGRESIAGVQTPAQVVQPAGKVEVGKTQSIADLLPNITNRKAVTENVDDMLAKQYGVAPETVRRLRSGYGDETAKIILARSSDATNIRDMNAFVISEARKQYGSPNVRIQRTMSPEEEASLIASAPDAPPLKVETPIEAPAPKLAVEPAPEIAPKLDVPESPLGTITEKFYDANKGNTKIGFRALEDLGKRVSRQIDDDFTAIGSDFSDVARRVQEGARNGAKTLEEAGLSPQEASILRKAQDEMNYIRRRASLGTKEVNEGNFGEMYIPQQKVGQYGGENLFEGFRDKLPGSELKRKNKIDLEDLDYSPDVIGEYITRYGDTKAYREQRIFNALKRNNPELDDELVSGAATKVIALQDKINNLKTRIGAFGFGSKKTTLDGELVDTVGELSTIGKDLGKQQIDVTGAPKGLTNGDKINSVMIGDRTAGDFLGLNQYRDAESFGSKQVLDSAGDRAELARSVEQRLMKEYNLNSDDLEYIVGGISRMADSLPDDVVKARVISTYKMAAKQQMLEQLQNVNITNPKLKKEISNITNQIMREGTIEQELSSKVTSKILQTQNAIFRKFNISSALNELGDLPSFLSAYGKDTSLVPDFKAIKEFGLGEIDAAIDPYIKQIEAGKSLKSVLKSINNGTNLYKFVEAYKAGVVSSSAKKHYMAQGLTGDDLVQAVLKDYRDIALPVDAFTRTVLDNAPLYTQYMTWGVRNLQKEGRLATGKLGTGKLGEMNVRERMIRNAYANLPAKTVWWLSSNGLKGTAILTAFGLTDFTGATSQDYSGIQEEDKNWFDKTTRFTNTSTTLSLINNVVQSLEKEQLKDKYANADYNPYEDSRADKNIFNLFTPQVIKNVAGAQDMMAKGYSENAGGKVQYEAPTDWWNTTKAYVFGKGNTENAREYSGRENIQDRIAEGQNPLGAIKDMALEQVGVQDTDYNRPLNDTYSEKYKELGKAERTALLDGGRRYNGLLDDLKKDNPQAYDNYISSMDGNHVSPEYWKAIIGDDSQKTDLTAFNTLAERNKQRAKDLGTPYDPIYDLNPEQAKAVLQQKSVATGDDIALRNSLYKEQWYKDYMAKVKGYFDAKGETGGGNDQTQRVKDWYGLNDQYNGLKTLANEDGAAPAWATQFPTVYEQKLINEKYGFDSDASKNFFKAKGDAYKAEKALYDDANLALINKMREIEGYPAMSTAQYAQVTNIENTDTADSKYGSNSKGEGNYVKSGNFGRTSALDLPSVKIKVAKVKIKKRSDTKAVKIQRNKKA